MIKSEFRKDEQVLWQSQTRGAPSTKKGIVIHVGKSSPNYGISITYEEWVTILDTFDAKNQFRPTDIMCLDKQGTPRVLVLVHRMGATGPKQPFVYAPNPANLVSMGS